jgi:hypothetical protein
VENEIWQCGVRVASPEAHTTPAFPTLAQAQTLIGQLQTQWVLTTNQVMNWCKLKWLKFSELDLNGTLKGQPLVVTTNPAAGIAGPQTTVGHPYQVALALTLWSGQTYGKANYGRIYLPAPAYASSTDGQISGSTASHLNWAGTWLKTIETSAATWPGGTAPMYIHIMNNHAGTGDGVSRRVAKVRMGDKMDTQRRRRNKLKEIYADATTYP